MFKTRFFISLLIVAIVENIIALTSLYLSVLKIPISSSIFFYPNRISDGVINLKATGAPQGKTYGVDKSTSKINP